MSYFVAGIGPLVANLRRDEYGAFTVRTPSGRIKHTHGADVAVMLQQRFDGSRGRQRQQAHVPSPRHVAAMRRAQEAIACCDAALACRARPAAQTPTQRSAVDRLPNSALAEVVGETLGRELRARYTRIRALEMRLLATPEARAAVRTVEALL